MTNDEIIEAVATALALQTEPNRQEWERPGYLREWHNHAIAAILATLDAIREPSEITAGAYFEALGKEADWVDTWRSMIDALRKEIENEKA